jgi:hypothetical protein
MWFFFEFFRFQPIKLFEIRLVRTNDKKHALRLDVSQEIPFRLASQRSFLVSKGVRFSSAGALLKQERGSAASAASAA